MLGDVALPPGGERGSEALAVGRCAATPAEGGRRAPPSSPSRFSGSGAKPRSRRLLVTTNTELNAIAAPAIIGLSSPAAASGIAATL